MGILEISILVLVVVRRLNIATTTMGKRDYVDDGEPHYGDSDYHDYGYDGYTEDSIDPGPWLLLGTILFCAVSMLILLPLLVKLHTRRHRKATTDTQDGDYIEMVDASGRQGKKPRNNQDKQSEHDKNAVTFATILRYDKETRKILSRAIPYTISGIGSSVFSNTCLALVGHCIGTHALSAYALVSLLVGLLDGIISGPLSACTTLCSHAVGANNNCLAGQYIQLALSFYLLCNVFIVVFWWFCMKDIILWLEWGDIDTAMMAQEFVRVYIWSYLLGGISNGLWQLLEVTDHVKQGTVVSLAWGLTNVVAIATLVTTVSNPTLAHVGIVYNVTAAFFIGATIVYAHYKQWLQPFEDGLFRSNAFWNTDAVKELVKQGLPLSCGYFFENAEVSSCHLL